jgi:hypothetical protein
MKKLTEHASVLEKQIAEMSLAEVRLERLWRMWRD